MMGWFRVKREVRCGVRTPCWCDGLAAGSQAMTAVKQTTYSEWGGRVLLLSISFPLCCGSELQTAWPGRCLQSPPGTKEIKWE